MARDVEAWELMTKDGELAVEESRAFEAGGHRWWYAWALAALAWLILSFVFAPEVYLYFQARGEPISWLRAFQLTLSNSAVAALFAPVIVWLARRYPLERGRWTKSLLIHIPASIAFAYAHTGAYVLICYASKSVAQDLLQRFHPNLLTYWAIVAASAAYDYFGRYRERERQLARLQTQLLRAQLRPHFLFNTLNTVSAMIHEDVQAADRMLGHLSEVLRLTLDSLGHHEVPLRAEIELVDRYLEIDRMRFDGGIELSVDASGDILDALVPSMLLQPLVENSVKHGFVDRSSVGTITIRGRREGGMLVVVVEDSGRGLADAKSPAGEGIGLSATRERLEKMYPGSSGLTIGPGAAGGALVRVELPFRLSGETG